MYRTRCARLMLQYFEMPFEKVQNARVLKKCREGLSVFTSEGPLEALFRWVPLQCYPNILGVDLVIFPVRFIDDALDRSTRRKTYLVDWMLLKVHLYSSLGVNICGNSPGFEQKEKVQPRLGTLPCIGLRAFVERELAA